MPEINLYNQDCMEAMAKMKDNSYDLAIVDVPYGIREDGHRENETRTKLAKSKKYHSALWDQKKPEPEYFNQLFRVSKNCIIWGANHLCDLFNAKSSSWLVWVKMAGSGNHFADAELAFTTFPSAVRVFKFTWQGMLKKNNGDNDERQHPTQKPVALYKWLLKNYAKEGDKILDTHGGSMSIAIACHDLKFDLDLWEIDKDYYDAGVKRFEQHKQQLTIF